LLSANIKTPPAAHITWWTSPGPALAWISYCRRQTRRAWEQG